jgi:hypothetical protein
VNPRLFGQHVLGISRLVKLLKNSEISRVG